MPGCDCSLSGALPSRLGSCRKSTARRASRQTSLPLLIKIKGAGNGWRLAGVCGLPPCLTVAISPTPRRRQAPEKESPHVDGPVVESGLVLRQKRPCAGLCSLQAARWLHLVSHRGWVASALRTSQRKGVIPLRPAATHAGQRRSASTSRRRLFSALLPAWQPWLCPPALFLPWPRAD